VHYPDGIPVDNVLINLRLELGNELDQLLLKSVSKKGIANFEIPALEQSSGFVWFEAYIQARMLSG
jgi:hypothetical protein